MIRRLIDALFVRVQAWHHRRKWPIAMQLEQLQVVVQMDARWLAHNPIASALCQRYADMLAPDWMRRHVRNVQDFREEIGLDPHRPKGEFVPVLCDPATPITYASTQATDCACCGQFKHTPLRIDHMDGYVCLTCIDARLEALLDAEAAASAAASPCGHPASLMLKSAETGKLLYCELCDAQSGRRDAEAAETELRARLAAAEKTIANLLAAAVEAGEVVGYRLEVRPGDYSLIQAKYFKAAHWLGARVHALRLGELIHEPGIDAEVALLFPSIVEDKLKTERPDLFPRLP